MWLVCNVGNCRYEISECTHRTSTCIYFNLDKKNECTESVRWEWCVSYRGKRQSPEKCYKIMEKIHESCWLWLCVYVQADVSIHWACEIFEMCIRCTHMNAIYIFNIWVMCDALPMDVWYTHNTVNATIYTIYELASSHHFIGIYIHFEYICLRYVLFYFIFFQYFRSIGAYNK